MCGLHQIVFYGFGKKGKLVYDKHLYYEFKFLFKDELWQQAYPLSTYNKVMLPLEHVSVVEHK